MSDITTIKTIEFPSTGLLPHHIADEKGFFYEEGLDIEITATPNSVFQITNLIDGNFHIAGTALDNIIAYQEGQGVTELSRDPDLFAFMGASQVNLSLVVQKEFINYQDLKGQSLAVDALSTGFAFMLREMLEINGLNPNEYELVPVGATKARLESLVEGKHAGALLNPPFTEAGESAGLRVIDNSQKCLPPCQIGVMAACKSWAENNTETLRAFIRAELKAIKWATEPANIDETVNILERNIPGMSNSDAKSAMKIMLDPNLGLANSYRINEEGVAFILALRSKYGKPKKKLVDPTRYIDLSYGNLL